MAGTEDAKIITTTAPGASRVERLCHMMASLSQADDARQAMEVFVGGMRDLWDGGVYIGLSTWNLQPGEYRIVRHIDAAGRELVPPLEFGQADTVLPVRQGGFLSEVVREERARLIRPLMIRNDPVLGDALSGYRCCMAVPMYDQGVVARWSVMFDAAVDGFDEQTLEHFVVRANLIGATLRSIHMAAELRQAHTLAQEAIDQVARIQRALLPERLPEIPHARLAVSYAAYDRAGGDIYLVHEGVREADVDEANPVRGYAIFVGDVSGHGPAAAVIMAMLHSILHAFPGRPRGPAEVLAFANRHLCAKQLDDAFITAVLAFYDPATRRMSYASAGHLPPLWRKPLKDGAVEIRQLDGAQGLPLGITFDADYTQGSVTLEPGQTLVFYTDGIPETRCRRGAFFGVDGLADVVRTCSGDASELVERVNRRLRSHEMGARPIDDQTLLAMQIL